MAKTLIEMMCDTLGVSVEEYYDSLARRHPEMNLNRPAAELDGASATADTQARDPYSILKKYSGVINNAWDYMNGRADGTRNRSYVDTDLLFTPIDDYLPSRKMILQARRSLSDANANDLARRIDDIETYIVRMNPMLAEKSD